MNAEEITKESLEKLGWKALAEQYIFRKCLATAFYMEIVKDHTYQIWYEDHSDDFEKREEKFYGPLHNIEELRTFMAKLNIK